MNYTLSATKKTIIRRTEDRNEYQATVLCVTNEYILGERQARGRTRGQYLLITTEGDRLDTRKKEVKNLIKKLSATIITPSLFFVIDFAEDCDYLNGPKKLQA